ncbi:MAG: FIST C-terminal domain-containing protein [Candidatus Omnitrophica bacterium]|nr:FIST C-terminal domain-containing protein [Candidatus Omnitrophota bacterium]
MISIGTGYSDRENADAAAEVVSRQAMEESGTEKVSFAVLFATADHRDHYWRIIKKIRKMTGAKCLVGASAFGVITGNTEIERRPGIALMTIASDELEATSFLIKNLQENNYRAGEAVGGHLASSGLTPSLLLLFPDTFSFQNYRFFEGFENSYGYLPMIGGTAAEDGTHEKTFQMEGDQVSFDAVSGIAFQGDFCTEIGTTQSCLPIGEPLQITRAEGNMIYEMDGRRAYDILLELLSHTEMTDPNEALQDVFLGIPLRSFQTDFGKSSYLIRNIMGVNVKKGMLACASPIETGDFVTFTKRDPQRAKTDLRNMLEDLKERLNPSLPRFGFYFNSCARGRSLYGEPNVDIHMIRQFFPQVPLLGFFTYGEFAPLDHVNHLHHYSAVLTLIV